MEDEKAPSRNAPTGLMFFISGGNDAKLSVFQAGEGRICSHDLSKQIAVMH
jgi:hypothetical protein